MEQDLKTITILFRAKHGIETFIREDIKRHGLNTTEFGVLEVLYHKGALPVKVILEKILIAPSSLSYVIQRLVNKNYIDKCQQESDGRSFLISLTEKGHEIFSDIYAKHSARVRERLDRLSKDEEVTLRKLLKKIGK